MSAHPDPGGSGGGAAPDLFRVYGARMATALPLVTPLPPGRGAPDLRVEAAAVPTLEARPEVEPELTLVEAGATGVPRRLELYRTAERQASIRVTDFVDVAVGPDRIAYSLSDPSRTLQLEIFLLGYLLALWLELRGVLALHASAVAVGDVSAGFLAAKEGGKTSLAAALLEASGALLADDLVAARHAEGEWRVASAFPQMRMWPEVARRFGLSPADLEPVHPGTSKRRVPVGGGGLGRFATGGRRLVALYVPEPVRGGTAEPDRQIDIRPLTGSEAVAAVLGGSFLRAEIAAMELDVGRLAAVGELVRAVPVRRLRYPWGYEHLTRVRDAVLEDLERVRSGQTGTCDPASAG